MTFEELKEKAMSSETAEEYPNIFEFASKELTQDAIVCWMLECAIRKISLGKNFLEKLIFSKAGISLGSMYEFECKPQKQCSRIDVYTCIKSGELYYPIIFEDKVNTTLHDNQLNKYCEMVREWFKPKKKQYKVCGKIIYVYFKTGYMFNNEKNYIIKQIENLNKDDSNIKIELVILELKDIITFLENEKQLDPLMKYYYEYCKNQILLQDNLRNNWNCPYDSNSLGYHIGQGYFFKYAFGDNCNWLTGYSGKTEYLIYNILKNIKSNDDWAYSLWFRFEPRWDYDRQNDRWISKTYLQVQLYRDNPSLDLNENWFKAIESIVKSSDSILKNTGVISDFDSRKSRKNNYKGAEIMRLTFNEQNTPEKVAVYINKLKDEINRRFSEFPSVEGYYIKTELQNTELQFLRNSVFCYK